MWDPIPTLSLKDQGQPSFFKVGTANFGSNTTRLVAKWQIKTTKKECEQTEWNTFYKQHQYIHFGYAGFVKFLRNCWIAQTLCAGVEKIEKLLLRNS
jgi:hypothetical protein